MTSTTLSPRQIAARKAVATKRANGTASEAAFQAHATRAVIYQTRGYCCAECMGATLDLCECPCGGKNHGILRGELTLTIPEDEEGEF